MGLLLLIPGIVLLAAGPWFEDQETVGAVLTIIGGVLLAIQALWFAFVASKVRKGFKGF